MNELHLFAGAGGGILAGQLLGRRCVCAVEREPYAQAVLVARQNDGTFPPFPIWDDVRTFDGRPWCGIVDVVSGGFPCQDISAAGGGAGIDGERSGLWAEMARIIREVGPRKVELENSPMLTSRGLGRVLGDLAEMGFDAEWGVISAADTGAPHLRERIWIVAHTNLRQRDGSQLEVRAGRNTVDTCREALANTDSVSGGQGWSSDVNQGPRGWNTDRSPVSSNEMACAVREREREREQRIVTDGLSSQGWQEPGERSDRPRGYGIRRWPAEPGVGRVVNGMANRAHRIKALGNGQVSRVAATAWYLLGR
ncbi:DNA cytosine methyltransferase [Cupriavidus taiwanensis]|uniref:DNA cytosine methyltransferase n=1 Tax=Cupriavidus taiwanensis TaxID=164546 RepID=UPI001571808A|nr:DNA cytosine methyltransferase [Cupriavidus taiwanensis]